MKPVVLMFVVGTLSLGGGCRSAHIGDAPDASPDAATYNCLTASDQDNDGISDHDEGGPFELDADGDGTPNYLDPDSDDDGLPDALEARDGDLCTPAPDTDNDGDPDYLDSDSDDDGCLDGDEDLNHDGVVGICGTYCPSLDPAECGPGQACLATGLCDPPVTSACAHGETDPRVADTDGDGINDCEAVVVQRPCDPQSPENPLGRRPVQFYTPSDGRFQVGVEAAAVIREQLIANSGSEDCSNGVDDDGNGAADCADSDCFNTSHCGGVSVTFDLEDPSANLAGFALAIRSQADNVEDDTQVLLQMFAATLIGETQVQVHAGGASKIQLGEHPAMVRVQATVTRQTSTELSQLRNSIVVYLLGHQEAELTNLPPAFNPMVNDTQFQLSFSVQRREPGVGDPYLVIMGGLATAADAQDPSKTTWHNLADAANGTGLAAPGDIHEHECENYFVAQQPQADILWVIDDSVSMAPARQSLATHGVNIFFQAVSYGLDFRMGVVNMAVGSNGVFCTDQAESNDFFLSPAELSRFLDCATAPVGSLMSQNELEHGLSQGHNAIVNHLPRADAPNRIRPNAQLAIIYLSDERAQELEDQGCATDGVAGAVDPACVQPLLQPTLNLLSGISDPEALGVAYAITGPPQGCPMASEPGQGYHPLAWYTAGFNASICQADLGATLHAVLEDIIGYASPLVLNHTPISLSLALNMDGLSLERSLQDGFDYNGAANTIVMVNQGINPSEPAEVVMGYTRWVTSMVPPD